MFISAVTLGTVTWKASLQWPLEELHFCVTLRFKRLPLSLLMVAWLEIPEECVTGKHNQ